MVEKITQKQRHGFQPGRSGNPSGRPRGSRNRTTLAAQALLDGEGEKLTRKAFEMAHAGDTVCLRLCLDRIIPTRRERIVNLDLPEILDVAEAAKAISAIIKAVAAGELTPLEAKSFTDIVAAYANLRAENANSVDHSLQ